VPADGVVVPSQELPPPLPVVDDVVQAVAEDVVVPSVVADPVPVVEAAPPVEAPVDEVPVPALAGSNGHSEDAPSSLGFFAS
jgi:hypothetical protein